MAKAAISDRERCSAALVREPAPIPDFGEAGTRRPRHGLRFLRATGFQDRSRYPLLAIDRAMEEAGIPPLSNLQGEGSIFAWKAVSRLRLAANFRRSSFGPVFVALMGYAEYRTLPIACWNELIPYCFDCWPDSYSRWVSFFKRHRVRTAFISARQSAEYFAAALPQMNVVWLPEATEPTGYSPEKPWSERDIDVLELSRRDDAYHAKIRAPLAQARRVHLYMLPDGKLLFPGKRGLADGLSRSRISMCFPKSQTHPELAGAVETATHRYFESIASKCLVVGHAPQELVDLFGYNPVVEVETGLEAEQLEWLLANPQATHDLIENNYRRLMEVGTWQSRVQTILKTLYSE